MNKDIKTYPVNLMLKGEKCLVVGGGKVAARKIQGLVDADCQIVVVAAKVNDTIKALSETAAMIIHERDFDEMDLEHSHLVFIATNDKRLNKKVLELCNERNMLCCAVDQNWVNGRFITPASIEKHGIKVTVSTHGNSCRRTRMIKDNLAKHIEMVENAELLIMGTDHNYMSLVEREPYHLVGSKYEQVGELLSHIWGIHEYMLINTCNRIELVAIVSPNSNMELLIKQVMGFGTLTNNSYYIKYGFEAFGHLSGVLAGLMSQTPGEKHIVAQLKGTLAVAKENGWGNSMIQDWMDSALHISKHIRQDVEPLLRNFEIEDLTMKYIESESHDLSQKKVLLMGTGVVGETLAKQLLPEVAELCWCYHQNKPEPLGDGGVSRIVSMKELKEQLADIDIVICATSSSSPIIHHGHAPFFDFAKPILVIDLAIPRNVSPELGKLMPNIKVIDLDDLKYWYRREAVDMAKIFEISNVITNEHKDMFEKILYHFQGSNNSISSQRRMAN